MDPQQLRSTIASARAGEAQAYATLLEIYGPRLYSYFLRATGRHHDAEDLLSEVMFRLVRRLKSYQEYGRFDQWLFRIAANVLRDRIRRIKAAPEMFSLSMTDAAGRRIDQKLAGRPSPAEARLQAAETGQQLQAALAKLDDTTRQMVLLRYLGGMSFAQLAELFECPLGTALARVHRGLQAMRRRMDRKNGTK